MKSKILAGVITLALISGGARAAMGATNTTTLNVSATVIANAQFTATSPIAFGNYDPTSATNLDASGSVTVRATKGISYTIYISSDRSMTIGGDTLNYELYSDAGRTTVWGSTLATGVGYTSTSSAASVKTIYGRIAAGQDVSAGAGADTVTVTVNF